MCQKQKDEEYAAYLAEPNSGALLCQSVNCLDSHKATQTDRARMFFCSFSHANTCAHLCFHTFTRLFAPISHKEASMIKTGSPTSNIGNFRVGAGTKRPNSSLDSLRPPMSGEGLLRLFVFFVWLFACSVLCACDPSAKIYRRG